MPDDTAIRTDDHGTEMTDRPKDYDTPEKELEDYPDVFADIINAFVYAGRQVVLPENLTPAPVETRYRDLSGTLRRQAEDIGKYEMADGTAKALFLLANQSSVDSRMILRKCGYTGGCYRGQYNGQTDKICPVLELVLYWGGKRWSSTLSIRRFFRNKHLPPELWKFIDNEQIHVFEMRRLPRKTIERFQSDMRIVLEYLSESPDRQCFLKEMKHPLAVLELLYVLLGNDRYQKLIEDLKTTDLSDKRKKGGWKMTDFIGEAWDNGIKQGVEQGIEQGVKQGIAALVSTCREFGATFDETAAKLKEKFSLSDADVQRDMALYW